MFMDKQELKVMEDVANFESEIRNHNQRFFDEIGATKGEIEWLLNDCFIEAKIEFVNQPEGDNQNSSYGIFKELYVDQWQTGIEGDSFSGYLYAKLPDGRWLKVSYCY